MVVIIELPNYLWIEIISTAVYLISHMPSKSNGGFIPKQVYIGRPPRLEHHFQNYLAYIHISNEKSNKLGLREKQGIFVDYDEVFRIYNLQNHKIVVKSFLMSP